jgi:hypothetical protein
MINLTSRIVIASPSEVSEAVRAANLAVLAHLTNRYGPPPETVKWRSSHGYFFVMSADRIKVDAKFDDTFFQATLEFCSDSSRSESSPHFFSTLWRYVQERPPAATGISSIRQGARLLLVELWNKGAILLPTVFGTGTHFKPVPVKNELYDFINSFEPNDWQDEKMVRASDYRRLYYYMPRILMATSWRRPEDVKLDEMAGLQQAQRRYINNPSSAPMCTSPVPWVLFLAELRKKFPERVPYDENDLKTYSAWTLSQSGFQKPLQEYVAAQRHRIKGQPKKAKAGNNVLAGPAWTGNLVDKLKELATSQLHDDAVTYFRTIRARQRVNTDWLVTDPIFPGREHVSCAALLPLWRETVRSFLHQRRQVKGYEDEKGIKVSLNILADYLFLYLPWWKEIYPKSTLALPAAPRDFSRYAFVQRSTEEPLSSFPITFPEMVKSRRESVDSQYAVLKHIQLFFKFVEAYFSDDEAIAGPKFRTPFFEEFDLPRLKKRTKTSKVVFPKNCYGYLIFYGYAVEALGQYIYDQAVSGNLSYSELRRLETLRLIDTGTVGYIPFVNFRGKIVPLVVVPNVFSWSVRKIRQGNQTFDILVPHLTTLRLLMAAVEVGLRLAGLRWLDRRTWDKENPGDPRDGQFSYRPEQQYVYTLYVNTDKTKEAGWTTSVVFRVRALLLREQRFQESIDENGMDVEVPYQGREHSRFGKVLPLFRSAYGPSPIVENGYQSYWVLYLIGFQNFLERATGTFVPFIKFEPRVRVKGSATKVVINKDGSRYSPISILAINTPHACRASFATNRQGILETSDIALLIGHEDPLVTEYYQSPRAEDVRAKLELGDRTLCGDHRMFERENGPYIYANKEDSALVRGFKQDREGVIRNFGFMPAMSLWSLSDTESNSDEALEVLRNGPMSLIKFRETHICPVGEECPADLVHTVGGYKRCGLCPLALKCVDHLPAISAKKNALLERIKYLTQQKERLQELGETSTVEAIWEELDLETNELLGWQFSEEILYKIHEKQKGQLALTYHAEQPDMVRRHLQRVVKKTGTTQFLLQRIAEANAYPSLQSPQIQAVAAGIRRRLLAGRTVPELLADVPGPDDLLVAAKLLKSVMQANELSLEQLSDQLSREQLEIAPKTPLRIGEAS